MLSLKVACALMTPILFVYEIKLQNSMLLRSLEDHISSWLGNGCPMYGAQIFTAIFVTLTKKHKRRGVSSSTTQQFVLPIHPAINKGSFEALWYYIVSQQIGGSVCSGHRHAHDVLIWNHFEFPMCSIQRKLNVSTHKPSIHMCQLNCYTYKAQPNTWKTHHAQTSAQKLILCSNTIFPAQLNTHSDASCMPICGFGMMCSRFPLSCTGLPLSSLFRSPKMQYFSREKHTGTLLPEWLKFGFCACCLLVFCLHQQVSQYRLLKMFSVNVIPQCFKLDTSLDDIAS